MKRLKILSLVILFVVIAVSSLVAVGSYVSNRIDEIDRTQALRSRVQARIHESIHSWYDAQIRDTRLISRCGITAYAVTLLDFDGNEFTLYYNIDNAAPVRQDLLNGCSVSATEPGLAREPAAMPADEIQPGFSYAR
jgi:hypothetical protein